MFFANRTPDTLVIGTVGGPSGMSSAIYDADQLSIGATPQTTDPGPSRVYLAPIIDSNGDYALRVFVVCFDGNAVDVFDPDTGLLEASIAVGAGPFTMAFDPYSPLDVALNAHVQPVGAPITESFTPARGAKAIEIPLPKYRFAYVASFTNSYVQVIDLDNSEKSKATFETVVYTLGTPSVPKGNQ
jgi:DNA-binding beta-propeller fold protein YncE